MRNALCLEVLVYVKRDLLGVEAALYARIPSCRRPAGVSAGLLQSVRALREQIETGGAEWALCIE